MEDDAAVEAERQAKKEAEQSGSGVDWSQVAGVAARIALGGIVGIGIEIVTAAAKAREGGLTAVTVSRSEAEGLILPPGHPRDRVIYAGPPVPEMATTYYPAASFHRMAFEHKFTEAIKLLMSLGATQLEVEHVRGWSDELAANLSDRFQRPSVCRPAPPGSHAVGRIDRPV